MARHIPAQEVNASLNDVARNETADQKFRSRATNEVFDATMIVSNEWRTYPDGRKSMQKDKRSTRAVEESCSMPV